MFSATDSRVGLWVVNVTALVIPPWCLVLVLKKKNASQRFLLSGGDVRLWLAPFW